MVIIPITSPDGLGLIRTIADRVWPQTYAPILTSEQITYMMEMMYADTVLRREFAAGVRFDVLSADGDLAGFLSYGDGGGDEAAKLHKLYLAPEYHHRGIGSRMLRHAIAVNARAGYRRLLLNVNKQNANALLAYRRNGFIEKAKVKVDIGGGFFMDDFVMERLLTPDDAKSAE